MNKKTIITALLALVSMAGQGQETPQDWFKTDTITVQGRIEDYDAKKFGFTTMKCHLYDVIVKDNSTLLLEIEPDGTLAKSFPISYPMKLSFTATEKSKVGFEKIPFFARPGETIDITIKPNEYGQYECHYNSGSSKDVERWLKSDLQLLKMCSRLYDFKGEFGEANIIAEQLWQDMAARIDSVGSCDHFTLIEMQLAQAEMQNHFAFSLIDYAFEYAERLMPWQQQLDGSFRQIVTDSTALLLTKDVNNYRLLKRVDFDNPLLMTDQLFFFTLNRVQWARPDKETTLSGVAGIKDRLQKSYAAYQKLMGSDHLMLTAQLCNYKYMQLSYNEWKTYEEAFPLYLSSFTYPYVRQKAEEFFQREMAKTELTLPLPEGPGMEIIHDIITRYPNRYLLIDFWGMGCGPCLMAIQSSKQLRTEIAKRDDVKLIFIADEKTVGGCETYKKYVAEWLADEDAVCLTNTDFNRLRELFQFNGIPHYETIRPDGRRVCDDLAIQGYDNFDYELERLKEKLK